MVQLTPEHDSFRQAVRDFAERVVLPRANEFERSNQIPREIVSKAAELGLLGVPFPPEYGGVGADSVSMAIAVEELARASGACSTVLMASYLVSEPVYEFGTDAQKQRWLAPIARGEKLGAHAMTEPGAGSDVAGLQSTAQRRNGHWVLTGRKMFITNADKAEIFLVFARSSPPPSPDRRHIGISAFLLERSTSGLKVGNRIETIGLRGSQPSEVILDAVEIPSEHLLGPEGQGVRIALSTYDKGRIGVAAQGVGIAQAAYEAALRYAAQRKAFDGLLLTFQQVQFKLADIAAQLHTSRLLTYWAASLRDQRKDYVKAASIAKIVATETAEHAALTAMMIHGGYGVATEYPVERYLRDSQIIKTYEGTNDIQRLNIAKQLVRELLG